MKKEQSKNDQRWGRVSLITLIGVDFDVLKSLCFGTFFAEIKNIAWAGIRARYLSIW